MKKLNNVVAKSFYMVRHGETTDNAKGLISGGYSNPSMTDLGRQQTREIRNVYMHLDPKPKKPIVSNLNRTHEASEIITGHSDYEIDPGLDERSFGYLDGKMPDVI